MSLLQVQPKFIYPHSNQFPFDEVTKKIVQAIEKRNWNVPGINLEFYSYGSGEAKYQMLRKITGDNFKLFFRRSQGNLHSHLNDIAAIHSICIPKQTLEVFEDESGPSYFLYVGNDWEKDKKWFMDSTKIHAKLHNEPRRYLRYTGNGHFKRATKLVIDGDFNREYFPEGDEPVFIDLEQKFTEITKWLEHFVLGYITSFPEADVVDSPTPLPELIPYTGPWNTIFSICRASEYQRIKTGQVNPQLLSPEERHACIGKGYRLVNLGVKSDGNVPEIAYDGFIWCDVNFPHPNNPQFTSEVSIAMSDFCFCGKNYAVAIKLKYANGVYVIDNSKFEETRQQLFKSISPRERLTDEELNLAYAARGATIVPITEYKGDYSEPLVLINRELDFDEIEIGSEIK